MAECLKPKPRNNEVTTRSRPKTLSTDGWANRMAQFHQVLRRSTNQAVTDHRGDLEVDPSSDWKPVELVADGSWYVAELGDVQDQPSGRVQHGLKPVKKIGMRPDASWLAHGFVRRAENREVTVSSPTQDYNFSIMFTILIVVLLNSLIEIGREIIFEKIATITVYP